MEKNKRRLITSFGSNTINVDISSFICSTVSSVSNANRSFTDGFFLFVAIYVFEEKRRKTNNNRMIQHHLTQGAVHKARKLLFIKLSIHQWRSNFLRMRKIVWTPHRSHQKNTNFEQKFGECFFRKISSYWPKNIEIFEKSTFSNVVRLQ